MVCANPEHRLQLICADAGYGKTILMGQLFAMAPSISVWYQLDKYDGEFKVFMSYLFNGLMAHIPEFGQWISERLKEADAGPEGQAEILHAFTSELAYRTSEPVHFYLDDFHLVSGNKQVNEATRFLIDHLHDGCKVVIGSRRRPTGLSLGKLKAQSALAEISTADLRFTMDETMMMFRKAHLTLGCENIAELHNRTAGWVVALALSQNLCAGNAVPEQFGEMLAQSSDIHSYLSEEIWAAMDEGKREFFTKASVLETIDAALIDEAGMTFDSTTAHKVIEEAVSSNLMIVSIGHGQYRLHPLFREFLRNKLKREMKKSEIDAMHRDYARALIQRGREEEAVDHFLSAAETDQALEIIIERGDAVIDSGNVSKVEDWLALIPKGKRGNPWLGYFTSKINRVNCNFDIATESGLRAFRTFSDDQDERGTYKCARMLCEFYGLDSDFEKSISFAQLALNNTNDSDEQADLLTLIACAFVWKGDYHRARQYLADVDKLENCSPRAVLYKEIVMLSMDFYNGDFLTAMNNSDMVDSKANWDGIMSSYFRFAYNHITTMYLIGKYNEAYELAGRVIKKADSASAHEDKWALQGLVGLLQFCKGDRDGGIETIEEAEKMVREQWVSVHKGTALRRIGNLKGALNVHKQCMSVNRKSGFHYAIGMCFSNIGADKLRMNDLTGGYNDLEIAEAIARKYGFKYILAQVYFHRAWRALSKGNRQAAKSFLSESLQLASDNGHNHFTIQEGKISLDLLAFGLENDIQSDYLIDILGRIGSEAIPEIRTLIDSSDRGVRLRGARALVEAGGMSVAPLVKKLLRDDDPAIKEFAERALNEMRSDIDSGTETLTPREMEVFELLGQGLSNAEIAGKLFISERTVKTHVTRIFRKLGLTRRSQAVIHFQQNESNNAV